MSFLTNGSLALSLPASGSGFSVATPPAASVPAASVTAARREPVIVPIDEKPRAINIVFAADPGAGKYDGVVGRPNDVWNLADVGVTRTPLLKSASGAFTPVRLEVSENDGARSISEHAGIFHGYIYHNCRCVDLKATLHDLPRGKYDILVYAHGDAPEQNANVELAIHGETIARQSTLNDGTWRFRSTDWQEGVQYVRFQLNHGGRHPVEMISHRDGSPYSMFNAIQIVRLED